MPRTPLDQAARALQDAAYVSVGLGVLAYQRLQVRRRELPFDPITLVSDRVKAVEERLAAVVEQR